MTAVIRMLLSQPPDGLRAGISRNFDGVAETFIAPWQYKARVIVTLLAHCQYKTDITVIFTAQCFCTTRVTLPCKYTTRVTVNFIPCRWNTTGITVNRGHTVSTQQALPSTVGILSVQNRCYRQPRAYCQYTTHYRQEGIPLVHKINYRQLRAYC